MGGIWNGDGLPHDTLRNVVVPMSDGKLVLSVRGDADSGYLLERRRWDTDGHLGVQRLLIESSNTVTAFTECESAFLFPEQHYRPLREAFPRARSRSQFSINLAGGTQRSDVELVRALFAAAVQSGVADCVFHAFLLDGTEHNVILHDTLIAGVGPDSALWAQHYSNKSLFRSDPVFLQARHHNYQAVRSTDLFGTPGGPLDEVRTYPAFQNSIFFPVRHEAALGILHVGLAQSSVDNEILDARARADWAATALDVLRHYLENRRAEAVRHFAFTSLEYQVLAFLVEGLKADEIERRLSISHAALRDLRQSINRKMGTHDIRVSVNEAKSYGLVVPSYFYK
ncbi:LuxR family transcriptional regulator [Burkholderia cepacia]|uniref:LuxR family transcriptional regulator n=1 Tax=Burkholderia cepacia TaxID=292 RepID=UPI00264C2B75|nr:LuxR family transcriptional regulator [Burkholderia cepacia]MDN7900823.1 LuxR family transcriptional regulator [Burkholderia cepacia]